MEISLCTEQDIAEQYPDLAAGFVNYLTQSDVDEEFHKLVAPLTRHISEDTLNNWQRVAQATNNIVTPANALDVAGFAGSMYGLANLDSWRGIIVGSAGFATDYFDGKVARGTGTASPLGEAIDAAGDKVKLAFALYQIWKLDLAPKWLVGAVAVQNGANIALTATDRIMNSEPVLHPSQNGKRAIFIEQLGLGMHIVGSEVSKTNARKGRFIKAAGTIVSLAGVGIGGVATAGYTSTLFSTLSNSRHK